MLPEFDLLRPASLEEALALLARYGEDALPLAGGTNALVELRERYAGPPVLIDIGRLPELRGIGLARGGSHLSAGACVTLAELLRDPLVARHAAPLHQAARDFASPLVRNRATVGGNLIDASPAADTAPPLLALGAEVELASSRGTRCVPLDRFFTGVRRTVRRPDELLTRVFWPVAEGRAGAWRKFGLRRADAISVISVAVTALRNGDGRCHAAAVALGAVAPTPIRVSAAEALLCGEAWTAQLIAEAASIAARETQPIDDLRGTAAYRRHVTEVIVRRLLADVWATAGGPYHGATAGSPHDGATAGSPHDGATAGSPYDGTRGSHDGEVRQ
jgi:carbon-monoxide dehydrogenase medium subunit